MSFISVLSPDYLVSTFGLIGIFFIVFAETGLLFGFFFPGDSLLFLAGAYAASAPANAPQIEIVPLIITICSAAILGGQTGYFIGRYGGEKLFSNPKSLIFKPKYLQQTNDALERYGQVKAVILGRFIPIVRTFISPVLGATRMPYRKFVPANIIGGLIWGVGVTLLGYAIGASIDVDKYLLPGVALIVLISLIPVFLEFRRQRAIDKPKA